MQCTLIKLDTINCIVLLAGLNSQTTNKQQPKKKKIIGLKENLAKPHKKLMIVLDNCQICPRMNFGYDQDHQQSKIYTTIVVIIFAVIAIVGETPLTMKLAFIVFFFFQLL